MVHPRHYEDWIKVDKEWVLVCDCVLRLSGESPGADGEVKLAEKNKKPVFYSMLELCHYYKESLNLKSNWDVLISGLTSKRIKK